MTQSSQPHATWSALVTVYQAVLHDVVGALEDVGMDSGVFSALAYLARATPPNRLAMSELQRLMHPRYSQPGFSRLIRRMEDDGLVERRADPGDGRAAILALTRSGRQRFRDADGVYARALTDSFDRHLSASEHARLEATLGRVMAGRARAAITGLGARR
jgi:DNA-binding MarR family transcriptional regulator